MNAKLGLERLIKKRCTTIFIGILDSIEQKIGYLWGFGKNLQDLSDRERLFYQLWKELRKEILDKGNNQTNLLVSELQYFDINMRRYVYEMEMNNGQ